MQSSRQKTADRNERLGGAASSVTTVAAEVGGTEDSREDQ